MTYKTGAWGIQAQLRSTRRRKYFRDRRRNLVKGKESLGFVGEMETAKLLGEDKLPNKSGSDFEYIGKSIDVKTALPTKNGKNFRWRFLLYTQKGKVDFFLIICKDINKKTKYMFLIPDNDIKVKNLSISEKSVNKYINYLWKVR